MASNSAGSTGGADRTFTTRNDNLNVAALYRMGENDGEEEGEVAADSVMHTVYDSVGGYHLKEPQVSDPVITAAPLFSASTGAKPAAEAGSTRALDFREGRSYASRSLFFTPAETT